MRFIIAESVGLSSVMTQHAQSHLFFLGHWSYKAEVISSLKQGELPRMLEKEVTGPPCPGN